MRVCPQCARKNKERARFCDQCGFEFPGTVGGLPPAQRSVERPPAETLKVNETAPGVPLLQSGVPKELHGDRAPHRKTQKLSSPGVSAGGGEETVKVPLPADPPAGPAPEATIQGAFYLRQREAAAEEPAPQHVGWLVEAGDGDGPPRAVWPITRGVTVIGAHGPDVGPGLVLERPGIADLHALLVHRAPRTWLLDLASAEGSALNGQPLTPLLGRELKDRDVLRLGAVRLVFRQADPHAPEPG